MSLRIRIYHLLVNRVPGIQSRFKKMRNQVHGVGRLKALLYLFWWNISYHILRSTGLELPEEAPFFEEKKLVSNGTESADAKRESPKEFAKKLEKYDVISFDVFDTLIFRPFGKPSDLFFQVGEQLEYLDFERIRQEMERKAREKKQKEEKHSEVTLDEIYRVLEQETGLDMTSTMKLELDMEYRYCFANPYMYEVVKQLKKFGKRIIITSDMYLNTEQIKEILGNSGYPEFDAYYISSDIKKSKSDGRIYKEILSKEGKATIAHVGDNVVSDIRNAKNNKISPFYYPNVNDIGNKYRAEDLSVMTGSVYRGLVNAHIHNGIQEFSKEYEFGYIYGGLFVTGYCQFIQEYAKQNQIDKILFLSRDGYILHQAYQTLYGEEDTKVASDYVYWSRLVATKMAARRYKYDYFRRFLYHKVNQNYTLKQIFASMEIEFLLEAICSTSTISKDSYLTSSNVEVVKEYLNAHWEEVLLSYEDQIEAGKQYYSKYLAGCKKVVAVDIGWAGSGAVALRHLVNDVWKLDCDVIGMVAGTNSVHSMDVDISEPLLNNGTLVSYMYSQQVNRDLWKWHNPDRRHNLYWEMLLGAPHGSLRSFELDESGQVALKLKEVEETSNIEEIHHGIIQFAEQWKVVTDKGYTASISGRDAYSAMIIATSKKNNVWMKSFINQLDEANLV